MIHIEQDDRQQVIEFTIEGKVTEEDMTQLSERIEPLIKNWDRVRMVEHVKSFDGITPKAVWEDLKLGGRLFRHLGNIEKCAVVTDVRWMKLASQVSDPLMAADVTTFSPQELDKARAWVRA